MTKRIAAALALLASLVVFAPAANAKPSLALSRGVLAIERYVEQQEPATAEWSFKPVSCFKKNATAVYCDYEYPGYYTPGINPEAPTPERSVAVLKGKTIVVKTAGEPTPYTEGT